MIEFFTAIETHPITVAVLYLMLIYALLVFRPRTK